MGIGGGSNSRYFFELRLTQMDSVTGKGDGGTILSFDCIEKEIVVLSGSVTFSLSIAFPFLLRVNMTHFPFLPGVPHLSFVEPGQSQDRPFNIRLSKEHTGW